VDLAGHERGGEPALVGALGPRRGSIAAGMSTSESAGRGSLRRSPAVGASGPRSERPGNGEPGVSPRTSTNGSGQVAQADGRRRPRGLGRCTRRG